MRPIFVFIVPVLAAAPALAGPPAWMERAPGSLPRIDLGEIGAYRPPPANEDDTNAFLLSPVAPPPSAKTTMEPGIDVGPFHATIGGVGRGHPHLGTLQLDTRDFFNSSIGANIGSRGARLTFTLPMH
jgi:hypothetical protein